MVCVKSVKLSLDEFILQARGEKVNRAEGSFTICLQHRRKMSLSFTKCSKNRHNSAIVSRTEL